MRQTRLLVLVLVLGLVTAWLFCGKIRFTGRGAAVTERPRVSAGVRPTMATTEALSVVSDKLGRDDSRYRIQVSEGSARAENPRHRLSAIFTSKEVTMESEGAHLTVRLAGYGYEPTLEKPGVASPNAAENRVEYQRGGLDEWYANGPNGLEQGFTIRDAPKKKHSGLFQIVLRVSGELKASVEKAGRAVYFKGHDGRALLSYSGLIARDAEGRELPAKLQLMEDRMVIGVEDSGAKYPIVVDPTYAQTAILTAGTAGSRFGSGGFFGGGQSIGFDESNDIFIAVASGDGATIPGSAYVFVKQGTKWTEATQLMNPDQTIASVAISGDGGTIVVGSCLLNNCVGHAFVYIVPNTSKGWSEAAQTPPTATLTASDGKQSDRVGFSVATDQIGDTVAFGAPCDFTAGITLCGSVYVFVQPNSGGWQSSNQEKAKLTFNLPSGSAANSLGFSVAMDGLGDTIVAGTPGVEGAGVNEGSGAAYVFVRPNTNDPNSWVTTSTANATLTEFFSPFGAPPNGDAFGSSVAMDFNGDVITVGAPNSPNNCSPQPCSANAPGMAYVFLSPTSAGGWNDASKPKSQDATLNEANPVSGDGLGGSLSISNDGGTIVAGSSSGAYVFSKPAGGWENSAPHEDQLFSPSNGTDGSGRVVTPNGSGFDSVAMSSDASTIAGANGGAVIGNNTFQGAVFLFTPDVCAFLTPNAYDFGAVPEYTTANFTFTFSNVCNTTLANINPKLNGQDAADFSINNNHGIPCATTLAANSSCNFTVSYTPLGVHSPEQATLSVQDLDGSSPQRASLTGSAAASNALFTITPISASPLGSGCPPPTSDSASCTATVKSGGFATYTFQLTSLNGFNSPVPLTFAAPLSTFPSDSGPVSFSSASVVPTASGATVTMTVGTQLPAQAKLAKTEIEQAAMWQLALPIMGAGLLLVSRRSHGGRWMPALALCLILTGIGGCDGSCASHLGETTNPGPSPTLAPGQYTIVINAAYPGAFFGGNNPPPPQPANLLSKVTLVVQ